MTTQWIQIGEFMNKAAIAFAALLTGLFATQGAGTAHADGPRSSMLPITLPAGSTGSKSGNWESWKTLTGVAYNVQMLRAQLPVGKPFLGVAWCSGLPFGTMQQWDWATSTQAIVVSANDRGEISLYYGPTEYGRQDCD